MASCFRVAHQAYLLIDGLVAAEGTPYDLAFGDNQIARDFIAASGVSAADLKRLVEDS